MRIEAHDHLGKPLNCTATRVVIYNDNDEPLAVAIQTDSRSFFVARLGDPELETLLAHLGIDKTVIVKPIPPPG